MSEAAKHWIDWLSVSATVSAVAGALPHVVLVLTGVWTAIRIYEGVTGKKFSETKLAHWIRWDWS